MIRRCRPPLRRPGLTLLTGWRDGGLKAVSQYQELDGPEEVEIEFMGIALDARFLGGGVADEMWKETFDSITEAALTAGVEETQITSYIYERNAASQKLARRMRLRHVGEGGPGVQQWQRVLFHGHEPGLAED